MIKQTKLTCFNLCDIVVVGKWKTTFQNQIKLQPLQLKGNSKYIPFIEKILIISLIIDIPFQSFSDFEFKFNKTLGSQNFGIYQISPIIQNPFNNFNQQLLLNISTFRYTTTIKNKNNIYPYYNNNNNGVVQFQRIGQVKQYNPLVVNQQQELAFKQISINQNSILFQLVQMIKNHLNKYQYNNNFLRQILCLMQSVRGNSIHNIIENFWKVEQSCLFIKQIEKNSNKILIINKMLSRQHSIKELYSRALADNKLGNQQNSLSIIQIFNQFYHKTQFVISDLTILLKAQLQWNIKRLNQNLQLYLDIKKIKLFKKKYMKNCYPYLIVKPQFYQSIF